MVEGERAQNKENKVQRELALNKRKMNEAIKLAEDLRREMGNVRSQASSGLRVDSRKPKPTRPVSSNPYKNSGGLIGVRLATTDIKK